MLSIPHVSCHSDFRCDFKASNDCVFVDDFWLGGTQFHWRFQASMMTLFSLLILCVNRELVFVSIQSVSRDSIFKDDFSFHSDSVFGDDFLMSIRRLCFTIPCVSHGSIFAIDLMPRSCCRFHTSAVTKISVVISRPTAIVFSLTISV